MGRRAAFLRRTGYDDGAPRQGGPLDFQLYAAYGYTGGRGTGFLWRLDMRGGADNEEWAAFLRALRTDPEAPPDWVVSDNSPAIEKADDVRLYTSLIRTALLANGGKPPRRPHELNDRKGERSIVAEARLSGKRAHGRQASQRQEAKESARRRERKIQRLLREGRPLPADVAPPEPTQAALDLD